MSSDGPTMQTRTSRSVPTDRAAPSGAVTPLTAPDIPLSIKPSAHGAHHCGLHRGSPGAELPGPPKRQEFSAIVVNQHEMAEIGRDDQVRASANAQTVIAASRAGD